MAGTSSRVAGALVAISGLMNFDCLAPHYDWMEAVMAGGLLQRARMNWLES